VGAIKSKSLPGLRLRVPNPICLPFEHVNLGAPLFERDFVHRQLHKMNAASVILFQIFDSHRIRNGARIKPSALV
jgi:hypothetical protein